jgi:hypothetical protein
MTAEEFGPVDPRLILAGEEHRTPGGFMVRVLIEDFAKKGEGSFDVPGKAQIAGDALVMFHISRLQFRGVAMGLDRLGEVAVVRQQIAEIDPGRGISRIGAKGLAIGIGRFRIATEFLENDSEIVPVDGIRGLLLERDLDAGETSHRFPFLVKEQTEKVVGLPVKGIRGNDRLIKRRSLPIPALLVQGEGFLKFFRKRTGI